MQKKERKKFSFLYFLCLFVILDPEGIVAFDHRFETLVDCLKVTLLFYEAFMAFFRRIPFIGMLFWMIADSVWIVFIAVIRQTGYIHLLKIIATYFLTYLFIDSVVEKRKNFTLFFRTTVLYLIFWTSANLWSFICFEDGFYHTSEHSWGLYVLGGKNGVAPFVFLTVLLCSIYGAVYQRGNSSLLTWKALALALLSGIFSGSTTLLLVSALMVMAFLIKDLTALPPCVMILLVIIVEILVVLVRIQTHFVAFFELLGKDATFSYRDELWDSALRMIKIKLFFGYGDSEAANVWSPSQGGMFATHNSLLEQCIRFGIPGMLISFAMYVQPFLVLRNKRAKGLNQIITYELGLIFIAAMTETNLFDKEYLFAYVFICRGYPLFFEEKRKASIRLYKRL